MHKLFKNLKKRYQDPLDCKAIDRFFSVDDLPFPKVGVAEEDGMEEGMDEPTDEMVDLQNNIDEAKKKFNNQFFTKVSTILASLYL